MIPRRMLRHAALWKISGDAVARTYGNAMVKPRIDDSYFHMEQWEPDFEKGQVNYAQGMVETRRRLESFGK
jgi:hypothetical protein